MKNTKFIIKIKKNNSSSYKKLFYDSLSILTSFDDIYSNIKDAIQISKESQNKKLKDLVIILKHIPTGQNITIKNKEDWNFIYNYNVISECIKNNSLEINYKEIDKSTNKETLSKIMKYIIETKIPKYFYIDSLISFVFNNEAYLENFISFFFNELFKTDLDNIYNNYNTFNLIHKNNINKESLKIKNYLIKTNEFLNLFNTNYLNILKDMHSLDRIKGIFDDKNKEKNQLKDVNKTIVHDHDNDNDNTCDDMDFDEDDCVKKLNLSFEKKSNSKVLFDNIIAENYYSDNNQFFKKFNKEEYYIGIEDFNDKINREFYLFNEK